MRYRDTWPIWAAIGMTVIGCGSAPTQLVAAHQQTPRPVISQIHNPGHLIAPTRPESLPVAHKAPLPRVSARPASPKPAPVVTHHYSPPPPPPPSTPTPPPVLAFYSCSAIMELWTSEGGNPGAAYIAAEIAIAESGGNPSAISPTNDFGLFQINGSWGAMASLNPYTNTRSAIRISNDGTDWTPWTTYRTGAYIGRC